LADRGEIRVGSRYQAEATPLLKEGKLLNLLTNRTIFKIPSK